MKSATARSRPNTARSCRGRTTRWPTSTPRTAPARTEFAMELLAQIAPEFLDGLLRSLQISAAGFLLAMLVGIASGSLRHARTPVLHAIVAGYVSVFRCTPLLVQIFLIFYALPEIGIRLSPFTTG